MQTSYGHLLFQIPMTRFHSINYATDNRWHFFAPAQNSLLSHHNVFITPFFALRKSPSFTHLLTFIHPAHIHTTVFMQIPQFVIFLSLSYICRVLKLTLYMLTYSKQAWLFHFCINHRK